VAQAKNVPDLKPLPYLPTLSSPLEQYPKDNILSKMALFMPRPSSRKRIPLPSSVTVILIFVASASTELSKKLLVRQQGK
jgi:hypothetical protein